jgi:hypothetical protein
MNDEPTMAARENEAGVYLTNNDDPAFLQGVVKSVVDGGVYLHPRNDASNRVSPHRCESR